MTVATETKPQTIADQRSAEYANRDRLSDKISVAEFKLTADRDAYEALEIESRIDGRDATAELAKRAKSMQQIETQLAADRVELARTNRVLVGIEARYASLQAREREAKEKTLRPELDAALITRAKALDALISADAAVHAIDEKIRAIEPRQSSVDLAGFGNFMGRLAFDISEPPGFDLLGWKIVSQGNGWASVVKS